MFELENARIGTNGEDLNGDGDTLDYVLRYFNISEGTVVNTGAEAVSPVARSNGKIIAFATDEATVGRYGADLNGDGDKSDLIVRYYDLTIRTVVNTRAEAWTWLGLSDNIIAFGSGENQVGRYGEDLNGDGDITDIVLRYVPLAPIPSPAPLASFTATPTSGDAPLPVRFTDTSTNNPDSWSWSFGDSSPNGSLQNPTHTYNSAGTYTVSLTVSNTAGSDDEIKPGFITVTAPDTTPPTVSITQPLNNATVSGVITIRATASDDRGVNRVELDIDNTLHSADNTSPYEYSWDTTTVR